MSKQIIDLGIQGSQSGDTIREALSKVNANFTELYTALQSVYYGDQQSLTYNTSSETYQSGDTLISNLPAGTYICILTLGGTTSNNDTTGYCKLKTSAGDIGCFVKWSKNAQGTADAGNFLWTTQRVITTTSALNVYPQYKRSSGTGSLSITSLQVTFIRIAS